MKSSARLLVSAFLLCIISYVGIGQIKWFNPQQSDYQCVQNCGFFDEMKNIYHRLPDRAKGTVRPPVWKLSNNSAGLGINFYSNSAEITIRYTVSGGKAMSHMPATGVSGVDLLWTDKDGTWRDIGHSFSFNDTIVFIYKDLDVSLLHEYHLYLPLYNEVTWMEIGVLENAEFTFAPARLEKPIVVYGTSIAQGACASRPANAWTTIVSRHLDIPLVNLGFSGNGTLDESMIDFINEIDACAYLLDCSYNLGNFTEDEQVTLLMNAVNNIRQKHDAPIVIVDEAGTSREQTQKEYKDEGETYRRAARRAYKTLKEMYKDIHFMTFDSIMFTPETTVEGLHPSDYGMMMLAARHEAFLRNLLKMPIGEKPVTIPVKQMREPYMYNWTERHEDILRQNISNPPVNVIIGNSITHYWAYGHSTENGKETWDKHLKPANYRNMGCGWDYIQNVLWRIYHGELDGYEADKILINIGTNNLSFDSDEDIVEGIIFLLEEIRERQPKAEIKFVAIYPRRNKEKRISEINNMLSKAVTEHGFLFIDVGDKLLSSNGKIDENLFIDGLHPNNAGYSKIAEELFK